MLLSNEDVERIKNQIKITKQKFAYLQDGYLYLKNKKHYCIFLNVETKKCSIYEFRPTGCRYYPIIFNPFIKKCVVDKDCTNKKNIPNPLIEDACPELQEFILLLEEERNNRLKLKKKKEK